jgi:epoxyqueuosine reductase QueG
MDSLDLLTKEVENIARKEGASLVGFGNIGRWENAPPEVHPHSILPVTRSVVAIGLPQSRGALMAIEEGTYWQAYNVDNYWYLNDVEAPRILRQIVLYLEERGYTAISVHNPFFNNQGQKLRPEHAAGPDGIVSLRMIGVCCGLGELGHSKLLLTPQYGPRQRIFAVFTDAELKPTPLFKGKICDGCKQCVKECEAKAIGEDRSVEIQVEDCTYCHAPLDTAMCSVVHPGTAPEWSPFWKGTEKPGEEPDYHKSIRGRFNHLGICAGRSCIRSCLDHLEKTGRIDAKFNAPLISKPRWKVKTVKK